jgi:PAS domain S-box-containing protein
MAAAAALVLGIVHALVWIYDRRALANLAFAALAVSVAAIAATELGMLYARTPAEWGEWARWCHLPLFVCIISIVLFLQLYFGTGNKWLASAIIALRSVIVVRNFTVTPNFNYERIDSIDHIRFLGDQVTVIGAAVTGRWQWLATLSLLLFAVFVVDATVRLWRRDGPDVRRKALVVGGGILAFLTTSILLTQLVIWGVARIPVMITLPFLITLGAMAFELSRDTLHARQLASSLGESERRLELAASAAGLGMWVWNIGPDRIWATERTRTLFGFSKDEPIDFTRWIDTVHVEDASHVRQAVSQAIEIGGDYAVEYRICLADGSTRWIATRGSSERDARGRPVLMRGVVRDITEQRRAHDESEGLRRELAHAGRVTMLGQLASALAHELSQPLGAILRNTEAAEMLLRSPAPDLAELREIVVDIHRDDQRAGEVIDRLRALLKRRRMDLQPIAVDGVMHDVRRLVASDATARGMVLEWRMPSALPTVSGDRVHLSQVLMNLIFNAMDASANAAGSRRAVIVEARQRPDRLVEVSVADSGSGIPPETMGRIFESFFTTKASGMGMGLPISRTIVEAHGGSLSAENNDSGGATFRFTLRVAEATP